MTNLLEQIAWEKELSERGVARYENNQDRLRNSGEADKCDGVQYLLQDRMQEVADLIKAKAMITVGRGAKYTKLLRAVAPQEDDYNKLAYMGLQVAFQIAMAGRGNTLLKATLRIGSKIEADLKCRMFQAKYPAYYHTLEASMKEQRVTDYMHKHKVFMKKFRDFEDLEWVDHEPEVNSHIGLRVLDAILEVFSDTLEIRKPRERGKTTARLYVTGEFETWIQQFENAKALLDPQRLPCKIPPQAWDGTGLGGYYTPELATSTQFVKVKSRDHRKYVSQHDPKQHRLAVNKMQRTAWKINTRVLDVQQEIYQKGLGVGLPSNEKIAIPAFPEHLRDVEKGQLNDTQKEEVSAWKMVAKTAYGREKKRQSSVIAFMQAYKMAQELKDWDEFYYVYTCDFRGRIYCATSGLSPQGADAAKGTIQFATGVVLGVSGVQWLAIQGANTYGNDKISYSERVEWVRSCEENIRRVNEDPVGSRAWWGEADKPYQFLAFCFEWADCDYGRNPNAKSSIPVGLDGSCNGLQHFSAMLRDEVGASATNLSPTERPQDIYQEVANRCTEILQSVDDPRARKWLQVGLTRKLAKRPVMTLPYGAKQTSARDSVLEWCQDYWHKFNVHEDHMWDYAKFLTPYLWKAIGDVVIAARAAMDWLQKNVPNDYCKWLTPLEFPVYQYYKEVPVTEVRTALCGVIKLKLRDLDCYGDPKKTRQRSGIAPNFVHSIDSTHMVMTINGIDLDAYAMIHDDFGTHAGNTERLWKTIRTSFHTLYSTHNPLESWAEQCDISTVYMPQLGEYDIDDIKKADYFFG